jgi:hypothetical protein
LITRRPNRGAEVFPPRNLPKSPMAVRLKSRRLDLSIQEHLALST